MRFSRSMSWKKRSARCHSSTLSGRQTFQDFAQRFTAEGDNRITGAKNRRNISPNFQVDDAMVAEFKEHVRTSKLRIDEQSRQKDLEFIKAMLRFEIDSDLFGIAVASENLAKVDPQMQFALGFFNEAEQLLNLGRRNQTSRVAQR